MRCWPISLLIVVLLQLDDVRLAPSTDEASQTAAEVSACKRAPAVDCAPPPTGRKVCGTDNTTYDSVCLLRLARCQGRAVELRHRGPCKDPQPCHADLNRYYLQQKGQPSPGLVPGAAAAAATAAPVAAPAAATAGATSSLGRRRGGESMNSPESSTYLPVCRKDGTYAAVQCHNLTGYCWCVTRRGRFVKGSTVKGSRPKCARAMKTRRGSSPGHRLHKRGCGHMERSSFNSNLIKIFRQEFEQSGSVDAETDTPVEAEGDAGNQDPNRRVLDWKFAVLDSDKDGILRRPEYSDLRRLVRKVVKPKRCARTFGRLCDLDRDRSISRQEWAACFGLDFSMLQESVRPSESAFESRGGPPLLKDDSNDDEEGNIGDMEGGEMKSDPKIDLHDRTLFPLDRDRSDSGDTEATDCITDRQAVLDEQRSSAVTTHDPYVPECTPDGRYNRKQCYNSTGYCWCVYEDSGKPIPGTSVKHQNPTCDIEKIQPRPFMGCPEPAKQIFLENLIEFLRSRMSLMPAKTGPSVLKSPEDEVERIVTWTFAQFDENKNKVLERREWKSFRQMVSTSKQLRRCGKKLPRHCDVNHDRKISMTEWLDCTRPREGGLGLGLGRPQHWPRLSQGQLGPEDSLMSGTGISPNVRRGPGSRGSRRKGLNPVERYLKP